MIKFEVTKVSKLEYVVSVDGVVVFSVQNCYNQSELELRVNEFASSWNSFYIIYGSDNE